jgi:GT2 family glycosyltransferase
MKRVQVVIVNFQTPALAIHCLRSLVPEVRATGSRISVVDNASVDDSVAAISRVIRSEGWDWVELLPLNRNVGFAGGNNAALRSLLASSMPPDYVWLLNPDTIVRPGALSALLDFMEEHPEAGAAGSRLEDPDGTPQCSAFRFPSVLGEFENGIRLGLVSRLLARWIVAPPPPPQQCAVDWLSGASLLVRRQVFETVGLLDEQFFLYFEEVDFLLRSRRAGWQSWYVPASRVVHLVAQASGVFDNRRSPKRLPSYWFESRRHYFCKNRGRRYALLADCAWMTGFVLWRLRRALCGKPDRDPPHYLWDFIRHQFLMP